MSESSTTCFTPENKHLKSPDSINFSSPVIKCEDTDLIYFKKNIRKNKIACIGAGYVGGPTMAVIAHKCPLIEVHVVDISKERIDQWNSDKLPVYEPGLDDLVKAHRGKNLYFSTNVAQAIDDCDIIFLCVNTPTKQFGTGKGQAADLTTWELASRNIAKHSRSCKIVIEKSTVPVHTADNLRRVLNSNAQSNEVRFEILSNPEFLAEGTAISDLNSPDRILIGGLENSPIGQFAIQVLTEIYSHWVPQERILTANLWSSELAKLVANAFLAQRISSINTITMLCERTGADVRQIANAVGSDSRIGAKFLNASVGFGGSCLQKDILSLAYLCDYYGLSEAAHYWRLVKEMNDLQKRRFAQRIIHGLFNTVRNKKLTIFGFAYKKNTADTRCSAAMWGLTYFFNFYRDICAALMTDGAILNLFDPRVEESEIHKEFKESGLLKKENFCLSEQFFVKNSPEDAVQESHAIIILTEWDVFTTYDYARYFDLMVKPAFIFDGRNLLNHQDLASLGFEVHGVGVPSYGHCANFSNLRISSC